MDAFLNQLWSIPEDFHLNPEEWRGLDTNVLEVSLMFLMPKTMKSLTIHSRMSCAPCVEVVKILCLECHADLLSESDN